jgi:hypothetical protein
MRVATAGIGLLLFSTTAFAQAAPCAPPALAYDPYKPSHLAIVREYGGTLLAHGPLSTLLALDPYVPSQAELLRLGRGIPLWPAYPGYAYLSQLQPAVARDCAPAPEPPAASSPPITSFADVVTEVQRERAAGPAAAATPAARTARGERINGVWIHYEGRAWASAGRAVPFRDGEFVRVGESGGFAIFRRVGAKDDLIFVPTTPQMVAPFRAVP